MQLEKLNPLITIDIGATFTRLAIFDNNLKILKFEKYDTKQTGLVKYLRSLLIEFKKDLEIEMLSISVAGPVSNNTAVPCNITEKPQISTSDFSDLFSNVKIINDATAAVVAESYNNKSQDLVYITISSGIGGGVIKNGEIINFTDVKEEIGHTTIAPSIGLIDMPCSCGSKNHWEAYCSGKNIGEYYKKWLSSNNPTIDDRQDYGPQTIYKAAEIAGSNAHKFIVEEIGKINTSMIRAIINKYEPKTIVFGGSVVLCNKEMFLKGLDIEIFDKVEIKLTELGDNICLIGAAIFAKNNL